MSIDDRYSMREESERGRALEIELKAAENFERLRHQVEALREVLREYMETYNVDSNGYVHDSGAMLDLEDRARALLGEK